MSFLKQILKPFIEFDPEVTPEKGKVIPDYNKPDIPTKVEEAHHPLVAEEGSKVAPTLVPEPLRDTSMPLKEHIQYFENLIAKANNENPIFVGADYKEFVDAKLDIDDIVDEEIKYNTAFNTLKAFGLTKEKLISTGKEYINIIGRDLNVFQAAHAQQYKKELSQKETDLNRKVAELQSLTQQMSTLKTQINQLSTELGKSQMTLDHTKKSFLLAGEKKQEGIQVELNRIAKHF